MKIQTGKEDKFWRRYIITLLAVGLIGGLLAFAIFTTKIFGNRGLENLSLALSSHNSSDIPDVYTDSISRGWENWSWDVWADFSSTYLAERGNSIRVEFAGIGGGLMFHAENFDASPYKSVKVSVYNQGPKNRDDLFIELAGGDGRVIGRQLLSWYAPEKTFKPGQWYDITVPLYNLGVKQINLTAVSIIGNPGVFYFDDVRFSSQDIYFPKWLEKPMIETVPTDNAPPKPIISLPYISDFYFRKDDWEAVSGRLQVDFGKMRLETGPETNYAAFNLKGGDLFIDYGYTIFPDWAKGDSINLISRYSPDNYFSCSFFDDGINVSLRQLQNGKEIELGSSPNPLTERKYIWSRVRSLGIETKGDEITCLTDGKTKVKAKARYPMPVIGSAALEMWSSQKGESSMSINKIIVEKL